MSGLVLANTRLRMDRIFISIVKCEPLEFSFAHLGQFGLRFCSYFICISIHLAA